MSRRRLAFSFSAVAFVLVACGSRTGLFGPDGTIDNLQPNPDAGLVDVKPPTDAPPDGPVPCTPGTFDFDPATAQLMFVIDRSGSMSYVLDEDRLPGAGETDRWTVLRDGLAQTLTGFDQQISMGAKFFPRPAASPVGDDVSCDLLPGVDIEPKPGNANAIVKVFNDTFPKGGTPTAQALTAAASHVSQIRGIARTLVLATDGAPNCNFDHPTSPCVCTTNDPPDACGPPPPDVSLCLDDLATIATVQNIADVQKVPVYVIGIGANASAVFRQVLDDMAVAGGRAKPTSPKYYSATTANELTTALTSIRDSVGSCTFLTPSAPTDPNAITVEIGGVEVKRDPSRTEGWDWIDQSYGTLALFGQACADAQKGATKVSGVVRCN
jgi:hypothetical protein